MTRRDRNDPGRGEGLALERDAVSHNTRFRGAGRGDFVGIRSPVALGCATDSNMVAASLLRDREDLSPDKPADRFDTGALALDTA